MPYKKLSEVLPVETATGPEVSPDGEPVEPDGKLRDVSRHPGQGGLRVHAV